MKVQQIFGFDRPKKMENANQDYYGKNPDRRVTSDTLVLVFFWNIKWPQHQRHLLLKVWTNVKTTISIKNNDNSN